MQTEESKRIMNAFYDPEPDEVACVAKCLAGVVIVGLIGIIGLTFNEGGGEKLAGNATLNARNVQAAQDPRQHEVGTQALRQTQVGANNDLERSRHTVYRAAR